MSYLGLRGAGRIPLLGSASFSAVLRTRARRRRSSLGTGDLPGQLQYLHQTDDKPQDHTDQGRDRTRPRPPIYPKPDHGRQRKAEGDRRDLRGPLESRREGGTWLGLFTHGRLPLPPQAPSALRAPVTQGPRGKVTKQAQTASHDRRTFEAEGGRSAIIYTGRNPRVNHSGPNSRNFSQSRRGEDGRE